MDGDTLIYENNYLVYNEPDPNQYSDGDSVRIFIKFSDLIDYGEANSDFIEWWFKIKSGGPVATLIEPLDSFLNATD